MSTTDSPAAANPKSRGGRAAPDAPTRWDIAHDGTGGSLVERVLRSRGLNDSETAAEFLDVSLNRLHDPAALPNIDEATGRILAALTKRRPITVYGDYDVDGMTASAILYHTLRTLEPEADVDCYVPHRLDEGYGLHDEALRQLNDAGRGLVISVDCGITATQAAVTARDIGLELIITDHHNCPADTDLPDATAIVHPRLTGSAYPFGELCGAGVAYKLAWRLAVAHADRPDGRASPAMRQRLIDLLPFAALGTIADMVPLEGENRILASVGLSRIRHTPFEGLSALIDASGLAGEAVDADAVGFRLAPRLNASGRMGHAREAVELFTTATGDRAREIAESLHRQNLDRQAVERSTVEQASAMAHEAGMTGHDARAIVLAHSEWHPGVVGIVCSRLVERFARPTVLLCQDGGSAKGSGRSIPGFNLHAALEACSSCLRTFGGHDAAAGLSLDAEQIPAFTEAVLAYTRGQLSADDLVRRIRIDTAASIDELTVEAVTQLERLRPFGRGNPRVRLLARDTQLARSPETFGAHGKHLSLWLQHPGTPPIRCIAWNRGSERATLSRGQHIDAVLTPKVSSYSGRVEPVIEDIRPSG
ncbi:MAG: single-stranded-DNA-specific exonuclease RecJ [Planctomycetota bacterium]